MGFSQVFPSKRSIFSIFFHQELLEMRRRAMAQDFSWSRAIDDYERHFDWTMAVPRRTLREVLREVADFHGILKNFWSRYGYYMVIIWLMMVNDVEKS